MNTLQHNLGWYLFEVECKRIPMALSLVLTLCLHFVPLTAQSEELDTDSFIRGIVVNDLSVPVAGALVEGNGGPSGEFATTSDQAGKFELGPFPPGTRLWILSRADRHGYSSADGIVAPDDNVQIMLDRNGSLSGKVIHAETRRPIENFKIHFHQKPAAPWAGLPKPPDKQIESDDGEFILNDVYSGRWSVTVTAEGYGPATLRAIPIPAAAMTKKIVFELPDQHSLRGKVLDNASGQPIADASLICCGSPIKDALLRRDDAIIVTNTDHRGEYNFESVRKGNISIGVQAEGYSETYVKFDANNVSKKDIKMSRTIAVYGKLLHSTQSEPVAGEVRVHGIDGEIGWSTPTDTGGEFSFEEMGPGRYKIWGESDLGRTQEQTFALKEGDSAKTIYLELIPGRSIRGTCLGVMEGERTAALLERNDGVFINKDVNCDGEFYLHGVPDGKHKLTLSTTLDRSIARSVEISGSNNPKTVDVAFHFTGDNRINGIVTRDGSPARFLKLVAKPAAGQKIVGNGETVRSGQYSIQGLENGKYLFQIGDEYVEEINVTGEVTLNIDLPALTISGVVKSSTGSVVPNANVFLVAAPSTPQSPVRQTLTNEKGEYQLSGFPAGNYNLSMYKSGYHISSKLVKVDKSNVGMNMTMTGDTGRMIKVRDAETSRPLQNLIVSLYAENDFFLSFNVLLDEQGVGVIPSSLERFSVVADAGEYQRKILNSNSKNSILSVPMQVDTSLLSN